MGQEIQMLVFCSFVVHINIFRKYNNGLKYFFIPSAKDKQQLALKRKLY